MTKYNAIAYATHQIIRGERLLAKATRECRVAAQQSWTEHIQRWKDYLQLFKTIPGAPPNTLLGSSDCSDTDTSGNEIGPSIKAGEDSAGNSAKGGTT